MVIEQCKSIQDAIAQKADIDAHDMVAKDRKSRTGQAEHKIAAEVANWRQIRDIVIGLRQQAEHKTKEHAEAYESALGGGVGGKFASTCASYSMRCRMIGKVGHGEKRSYQKRPPWWHRRPATRQGFSQEYP